MNIVSNVKRFVSYEELFMLSDEAMRVLQSITRKMNRKGVAVWSPQEAVEAFDKTSNPLTLSDVRDARDELLEAGHIEPLDDSTPLSDGVKVLRPMDSRKVKKTYRDIRKAKRTAVEDGLSAIDPDVINIEVLSDVKNRRKSSSKGVDNEGAFSGGVCRPVCNNFGHSCTHKPQPTRKGQGQGDKHSSSVSDQASSKTAALAPASASAVCASPKVPLNSSESSENSLSMSSSKRDFFYGQSGRRIKRRKITPNKSQKTFGDVEGLVTFFNTEAKNALLQANKDAVYLTNDGALRKAFRGLIKEGISVEAIEQMITIYVAELRYGDGMVNYPYKQWLYKRPELLQQVVDRSRLKREDRTKVSVRKDSAPSKKAIKSTKEVTEEDYERFDNLLDTLNLDKRVY